LTGFHLLIRPVDESGNVAVDVLDRCVRELDVLQVVIRRAKLTPRIAASGNVTESPSLLAIRGELIRAASRLSRPD
jgi:hypothetical protein